MTSKLSQDARVALTLGRFPDFPPRDDMQNSIYLDRPAHQAALEHHFGNPSNTIVLSEIPVRWAPSQAAGHRIPDLLVAFGVDREQAVAQNGYSIRDLGKPPDFVLEVASVRTADNDVVGKRVDYANFGIPEYWRFDPTGGQRYDAPLAGDRLVDGEYQPISIVKVDEERYWGHSDALNLDLCWEHGELRWYDPASRRYIASYNDQANARAAAEAQLSAAEDQLSATEAELSAAEAELESERQARVAAEARVRELEEQLGSPEGGQ